jgi:hypothetical protein
MTEMDNDFQTPLMLIKEMSIPSVYVSATFGHSQMIKHIEEQGHQRICKSSLPKKVAEVIDIDHNDDSLQALKNLIT